MAVDESTQGLERETDALTGFGTRSVLLRDLEEAIEPGGTPSTLGILDLRAFLDLYGRLEADGYIGSVARQLAGALEGARFYRPRQEEIAVLVEVGLAEAERLFRAAATTVNDHLTPQGIAVSFGSVSLPDDASDAVRALSLAESRNSLRRRRPRERRLFPRS
jgi:GGDEF domain-containing protein